MTFAPRDLATHATELGDVDQAIRWTREAFLIGEAIPSIGNLMGYSPGWATSQLEQMFLWRSQPDSSAVYAAVATTEVRNTADYCIRGQ